MATIKYAQINLIFCWWLLRYMSSPGQMLGFQFKLLKKIEQAIVEPTPMPVWVGHKRTALNYKWFVTCTHPHTAIFGNCKVMSDTNHINQ